MIDFANDINEEDFEDLEDGEAYPYYLVGKRKVLGSLRLAEITLTIVDPLI